MIATHTGQAYCDHHSQELHKYNMIKSTTSFLSQKFETLEALGLRNFLSRLSLFSSARHLTHSRIILTAMRIRLQQLSTVSSIHSVWSTRKLFHLIDLRGLRNEINKDTRETRAEGKSRRRLIRQYKKESP